MIDSRLATYSCQKMRATVLAAIALASAAVLAAGCGTRHGQRATSTVKTPNVQALRLSKMEREWLTRLGLTLSAPAVTGARAEKREEAIRRAARKPGVQVVSLKIYSTPVRASSLAPALVLAVARPAHFLRHQLRPIIPLLNGSGNVNAFYLRVVDERRKTVLEWSGRPARNSSGNAFFHGELYVRHGLERCSPIAAGGGPMIGLPPCPSK